MGELPSNDSDRPAPGAAPPATVPARRRPMAHRTQERRHALIIGCCAVLLGGMTAKIVVATVSARSVDAANSPFAATAMPERDLRTARITTSSAGNGCSEQLFDNQSGRMLRSQKPCDTTMSDIDWAPVPLGTIHRLDAISKSISGH
jgi:hypothetical protein